jgi:exonuclease VII small subunit
MHEPCLEALRRSSSATHAPLRPVATPRTSPAATSRNSTNPASNCRRSSASWVPWAWGSWWEGSAVKFANGLSDNALGCHTAISKRRFEISICHFETSIRRFEISICRFEISIRRFEIRIRRFETSICHLEISVWRLETSIRRFETSICHFETSIRRLEISIHRFETSICHFEISICHPETSIGRLETWICRFEIPTKPYRSRNPVPSRPNTNRKRSTAFSRIGARSLLPVLFLPPLLWCTCLPRHSTARPSFSQHQ